MTSHSEQGFANNLSASSNNSDNSNGKSGSDLNVERVKKSVSETEVAARPKKVGKLASELRYALPGAFRNFTCCVGAVDEFQLNTAKI